MSCGFSRNRECKGIEVDSNWLTWSPTCVVTGLPDWPQHRLGSCSRSESYAGKFRAVIEYVEVLLDVGLSMGQMAAASYLSAYHFARQLTRHFKRLVGASPGRFREFAR